MVRRLQTNRHHERGFSLMEILVAVAIFATVMIVALLMYDRSNRVFKDSNEAAGVQQNTRVAFEKVAADLRMAGFDYKRAGTPTAITPAAWVAARAYSLGTLVTPITPNGHVYRCIDPGTSGAGEPAWTKGKGDIILDKAPLRWQENGAPVYEQPDEQIEYAHSAAITLRANFDYDEPNTDNGRETKLEESTLGSFPVVTTGNDEIVTYALVSKSGNAAANKNSITFYADVNDEGQPQSRRAYPGGSNERLITIPDVDLTNQYPPYTLMRYTISETGTVQGAALADNIRSMNFSYWEDAQATRALTNLLNAPVTDVGGLGQYKPATPDAKVDERIIRGKIRAVTMNVVGMNPIEDPNFVHPTDTIAKNYRQYALQTTIVGRNLGLEGVPQTSNNPPGPPTVTASCNGYCGITELSWKPDPTTPGYQSYTILYDKSPTGSFSGVLPAGTQTSYAVDLTQSLFDATTYYFKVAATNENGTTVSKNFATVDIRNATKPKPPAAVGVVATATKANEVVVSWATPTQNASGDPSCTTGTPTLKTYGAEIKGYRLYRSMNPGFKPGETGVVELMNENTGGASTDGSGKWSYVDKGLAACEKYYYQVLAVEWCAASTTYNTNGAVATGMSDASTEMIGETYPLDKPRKPQNLKVDAKSTCDADTNLCDPVIISWDPVTKDLANNDVVILDYEIVRKQKLSGVYTGKDNKFDIDDGSTTFTDPDAPIEYMDTKTGEKYSYEYSITAYNGYGSSDNKCNLGGEAGVISFPDSCSVGAVIKADSGGGTGIAKDPWTDVVSIQVAEGVKKIVSVDISLDGGTAAPLAYPYLYSYDDLEDGKIHTVEFIVKAADCTERITVYIQNDAPTCLLTGTVVSNSASSTILDIDLRSTATEIITIDKISITWASQSGLAWNSITYPSTASQNNPNTPTSAGTATFTPPATDKTIAANGNYKIKMNFGGTVLAQGDKVTGVTVQYTVPSTGTVPHNCPVTITRCSVAATAKLLNSMNVEVTITNSSTEALNLQTFSIRWTDQNKIDWDKITLPSGATLPVVSSKNGGTETFTPPASDKTIAAGQSYTFTMNFSSTFNNPPDVDVTNVGAINVNYRTPISGTVTLGCRAK